MPKSKKKKRSMILRAGDRDVTVTPRSDGRWQTYYFDIDANGKRGKRHCLCGKDPQELARRVYEKEHPPEITFAKTALEWQRAKWDDLSPNTVSAYKAPLRRALERFGDCPLSEISTLDVTGFLAELAEMEFSKSNVAIHKTVASLVFEFAIVNGWVDRNPTERAVVPRNLPQSKREPPSDEALEAVENGLDLPFGLFAYLLRYSGLRRGEALALQYSDIDRKNGVIHVTKTLEFEGNAPYIKAPKSECGTRDVILVKPLADALPFGIGNGYLFCRDDEPNKPLTSSAFYQRWNAYCKALGHKITPHQLRHAYASMLYEMGVGIKEAQKLLGHSNSKITMDVYTHIGGQRMDYVADTMNAYLNSRSKDTDGISDGKSVKIG